MFLPEEWYLKVCYLGNEFTSKHFRYNACDELGIMVYHDMQYAQGGTHLA